MDWKLNFDEEIKLIKNFNEFEQGKTPFIQENYANLYGILTPALSWSSYNSMFKNYLNLTNTKKISIYNKKSLNDSKNIGVFKYYEYTSPDVTNNKEINVFAKFGSDNKSITNTTELFTDYSSYDSSDVTNLYKFTSDIEQFNEKNFQIKFYDPTNQAHLPITTYFMYNSFLFKYIEKIIESDIGFIYSSLFNEISNYYFNLNSQTITFKKIPLLDAFCFSGIHFLRTNMDFIVNDESINEFIKTQKSKYNLENYNLTMLPEQTETLSLFETIEFIKTQCTLLDYEKELYKLYLRTSNKIFIILIQYYEQFGTKYVYSSETLEFYRQFTYKYVNSIDDLEYNKKIKNNTSWYLIWDLIYFNIITNTNDFVKTSLFNIIFYSYMGNNIVTGSTYFTGLNINKYFIKSTNKLEPVIQEIKDKIISGQIHKITEDYTWELYDILNYDFIDFTQNTYTDARERYLFKKFILSKLGLLGTEPKYEFDLGNDLFNILKFIDLENLTAEQAIRLWDFNFNNFYKSLVGSKNLQILDIIGLNLKDNKIYQSFSLVNAKAKLIEHIVSHSNLNKNNYVDCTLPTDSEWENILTFVFYGQTLKLLTNIMISNSINKTKARELDLINKSIYFDWKEGYIKILESLGGIKDISSLIKQNQLDPKKFDISSNNFEFFLDIFIDGLKQLETKSDVNDIILSRPYLLEFVASKLTYVDNSDENKIKYVIDKFFDVLYYYNKKSVNGKPLVSSADIKDFSNKKYGPNGDNLLHLVTQTGSTILLQHLLQTKKSNVKISFLSTSDNLRNILFYIKSIEQLEFILSLESLTPNYLAQLFYQVDNTGKSVLFTWFDKESYYFYDFVNLILKKLSQPLEYNTETIISGFTTNLTEYLANNPIDNFDLLVPLLKKYNLITGEIDLYYIIGANFKKSELTEQNIEKLKKVLNSPKILNLLDMCIKKNYNETLNRLFELDTTDVTLKYYIMHIITNTHLIIELPMEIFTKVFDGKQVIEHLVGNIYNSLSCYFNVLNYFSMLKKTGKLSEIAKLKLLPGLLEINKSTTYLNWKGNKEYIKECFSLAFYLIKNFVTDEEINKPITDNSGYYKPIHVLYGFGRSAKWKNIGGYLNLYYYLYGKTTDMPDFRKPIGYDDDDVQIEAKTFAENDFDMDLIPETPANKTNIPVLDHYITFPQNHELSEYENSYVYTHKDYSNFIPYKFF